MGLSFEKLKHPSQSPLFLFCLAEDPRQDLQGPNSCESQLSGRSAISLRLRLCRLLKPHSTIGRFGSTIGFIDSPSTHLILSPFGRVHNRYRPKYPQELSFVKYVLLESS
jgi:hypothetical protein